jgi:hypothetical protein
VRDIPFDWTPYQTALFVRSYLARPLPKTPQAQEVEYQRFEKLEQIIKGASQWTVNTVVWNMLIKQAGVSKRYSKMFDLFNNVSQLRSSLASGIPVLTSPQCR